MIVTFAQMEQILGNALKSATEDTIKFARTDFKKRYASSGYNVTHHQLRGDGAYLMQVSSFGLTSYGTIYPIASPQQSIINPSKYPVQWGTLAYLFETGNRYNLSTRTKDPAVAVSPSVRSATNTYYFQSLKSSLSSSGFGI